MIEIARQAAIYLFSYVVASALAPSAEAAACIPPPTGCSISSHYGNRMHPTKHINSLHSGTDFACGIGTPAKAVEPGVIIDTGFDYGGGNHVYYMGFSGREFKYFHLSRFMTAAARMQPVSAGQVIAYTGNTGAWTTGPHVHFEVWLDRTHSTNAEPLLCGGTAAPGGGLDGEDPAELPMSVPGSGLEGGPGPATPMGLDGSLESVMANIIATRALNPDYSTQLATLPAVRLYGELAYIEAASLRLEIARQESRERVEAMLALRHVLLGEQVLQPTLNRARSLATAR